MAAISTVDDTQIGVMFSQDLHLFECFLQGMAVVGIVRKAAHPNDEALVQRGGHAELAAELVTNARFALGDAIDIEFVQGVNLVSPPWIVGGEAVTRSLVFGV